MVNRFKGESHKETVLRQDLQDYEVDQEIYGNYTSFPQINAFQAQSNQILATPAQIIIRLLSETNETEDNWIVLVKLICGRKD